ncbi:MAG: hypothetical protein SOZ07_08900 [Prevotella sp.]|nr:hypothetical protein [Prevotella sp.]
MANWASTSYQIEGSKEELQKLFDLIDGFVKERLKPVCDAAQNWEGNILQALGATEEQISDNYLRGFISHYEMEENSIRMDTEEAWGATDFRHVLRQLMPELTIYYIVEEPGCEVYATNDMDSKYFTDRFKVDAYADGEYWDDYYSDKETALKHAAQFLKKEHVTEADIDEYNKEHEDDDNYLYLYEFKITDC